MSSLIVEIELPPGDVISSNNRINHYALARKTRHLRTRAFWTTRSTLGREMAGLERPVTVNARIAPPSWRAKRDSHNLAPTVKPLLDGIVDAGGIPDDSDHWVRSLTITPAEPTGNPYWWHIAIELEEV